MVYYVVLRLCRGNVKGNGFLPPFLKLSIDSTWLFILTEFNNLGRGGFFSSLNRKNYSIFAMAGMIDVN